MTSPTPMERSCTTHQRPGSLWRMLLVWSLQETRLLFREPVAVFFSLAFPVIIYVFLGIPYGDELIREGVRFIDIMFPALGGTVAANLLLMGLPIYVAQLRTREVDKRYKVIPLPGAILALSVVFAMLILVVAADIIIIVTVGISHGIRSEAGRLPFILLNLGFIGMLAPIGFFLGTLPLSPRTIQALTAAVFFVLFFGSGAAVPIEGLPQWLQQVLEWNPVKIWFDQMINAYTSEPIPENAALKVGVTLIISVLALIGGLRNWRRVL